MQLVKSTIRKTFANFGYELFKKSHGLRMNYPNVSRLIYFKRAFDMVKDIDGDIVECGVARGYSFLMLAFLIKDEMKERKLWGFDSFEGFPEPSKQDKSIRNPKKGEWGEVGIYTVQDLLLNSGLDREFLLSQITLIKGFFNESLKKYTGNSIAMLHLDVDLYDSYLTALRELYPKVASGGIVLFDEYLGTMEHLRFPGAQKAIDEYFGENKSLILRNKAKGKYYLIKK